MTAPRILVIGANGQVGTELVLALAARNGASSVIASDIAEAGRHPHLAYHKLDVTDAEAVAEAIRRHSVNEVYLLAAALSATAERSPRRAWDLNMNGLLNVLEAAHAAHVERVFWPSSIAAFGITTPPVRTPQHTVTEPGTVYGISKLAGEGWCRWFHENRGLDVRSLRYPGLVSWRHPPGGGTSDYAVEMIQAAIRGERYVCFLDANETLPMMYMDDAVRATIELMAAPRADLSEHGSYNVAGVSFSPLELVAEIRRHLPAFRVEFAPDFRQRIAHSWPDTIDDSAARADWAWRPRFGLAEIVGDMIVNLKRNPPPPRDGGAVQPAVTAEAEDPGVAVRHHVTRSTGGASNALEITLSDCPGAPP
jgi:nucleoside-diphosphate-sugar epimerase